MEKVKKNEWKRNLENGRIKKKIIEISNRYCLFPSLRMVYAKAVQQESEQFWLSSCQALTEGNRQRRPEEREETTG